MFLFFQIVFNHPLHLQKLKVKKKLKINDKRLKTISHRNLLMYHTDIVKAGKIQQYELSEYVLKGKSETCLLFPIILSRQQ